MAAEAGEEPPLQQVEVPPALQAWVDAAVAAEVARIQGMGSKCLPVPVTACGTATEEGTDGAVTVHVVHADTKFDFAKVKQVMLSEPMAVPEEHGTGLQLLFLVLLAQAPIPLLLPYLHVSSEGDKSQWRLCNAQGSQVRHSVGDMAPVTA